MPRDPSDAPIDEPSAGETPIQKALRLKKAAQGRGGPPGVGRVEGERAAAHRSASKSKPWMKR